jgi:osmotically inducible protein OsmC
MAFSGELGRAGGTTRSLEVTAEVEFGPDPAGGFHISSIKLTVRGEVDGVDEATFLECAEKAKAGCPISKALAAVPEITLDAALEA